MFLSKFVTTLLVASSAVDAASRGRKLGKSEKSCKAAKLQCPESLELFAVFPDLMNPDVRLPGLIPAPTRRRLDPYSSFYSGPFELSEIGSQIIVKYNVYEGSSFPSDLTAIDGTLRLVCTMTDIIPDLNRKMFDCQGVLCFTEGLSDCLYTSNPLPLDDGSQSLEQFVDGAVTGGTGKFFGATGAGSVGPFEFAWPYAYQKIQIDYIPVSFESEDV